MSLSVRAKRNLTRNRLNEREVSPPLTQHSGSIACCISEMLRDHPRSRTLSGHVAGRVKCQRRRRMREAYSGRISGSAPLVAVSAQEAKPLTLLSVEGRSNKTVVRWPASIDPSKLEKLLQFLRAFLDLVRRTGLLRRICRLRLCGGRTSARLRGISPRRRGIRQPP